MSSSTARNNNTASQDASSSTRVTRSRAQREKRARDEEKSPSPPPPPPPPPPQPPVAPEPEELQPLPAVQWRLPVPNQANLSCNMEFFNGTRNVLVSMCDFSVDNQGLSAEVWLCDEEGNKVARVLWSVLQAKSDIWRQMSQHGFVETVGDGGIRLTKCNRDTVLALRDFLYVGHPRELYLEADARALYRLGAYYGIPGLREWLLSYAIGTPQALFAALRNAMCPDDEPQSEERIRLACMNRLCNDPTITETCPQACLVGIDYDTMDYIIESTTTVPDIAATLVLRRSRNEGAFRLLDKWYSANVRYVRGAHAQACRLFGKLDLKALSGAFMLSTVQPSTLIPPNTPAVFSAQCKTMTGQILTIPGLGPFSTGLQLREGVNDIKHYGLIQIRLVVNRVQIEDGDVLLPFELWRPENEVSVILRLIGDIGFFLPNAASGTATVLQNATALATATVDDAIAVLQKHPNATWTRLPMLIQDPVLSVEQCNAVIAMTQSRIVDRVAFRNDASGDFVTTVSESDLRQVIGADSLRAIVDLFERFGAPGAPNRICLRYTEARTNPVGPAHNCIDFHTDQSRKTMQVVLNGDEEYDGARLIFATHDGFTSLPRRRPGAYSIHEWDMVHGVTALRAGARYALFFLRVEV